MYKYVYLTILLLLGIGLGTSVEIPDMFNKGQRMDKLVIRNQVGYHFKKVIREVSQELFVSRKVDLSALLHGIQILEQTKDTMKQYCYDLAYAEASSASQSANTPDSRSPTKDLTPHTGQ